ncbi:tail terminator [Mycobacterium phage LeMond]|uniref:Tail terminator n=1 Tax=Mycobacterium phage KiSi TaxID=2507856 RepID=A0A410TBZ7_9CAUD|nr:tail terminator [Mycobacterium phage KiSi]AYR01081.1 tail terminator [Mycobacterium phage LeMond]AYR01183.1 tail terminator [Mycobacterium phage Oscar]AYR01616.1 tail terminator [Mycobacterium phage Scarlett]QAU06434.1 tail terminator [Mycobacterium phage KiSi]
MTVLVPPVGPLTAARRYLLDELAARGNPLPVGGEVPDGEPVSYALLSRPGTSTDVFLQHSLIRVRVYDSDLVRLERNADLLHRLLLHAVHKLVVVPDEGAVWITGATHEYGPADLDDRRVPLAGMQSAVFWTIGLRPEA